jgi:hypothetical protein
MVAGNWWADRGADQAAQRGGPHQHITRGAEEDKQDHPRQQQRLRLQLFILINKKFETYAKFSTKFLHSGSDDFYFWGEGFFQGCGSGSVSGSGSGLDPDSMGCLDPEPDPDS